MSLCQLPREPFYSNLNESTINNLFEIIYRLDVHQSDYTHRMSTNTFQQKFNHITPTTNRTSHKEHESRCCVATDRASVDNMAFTASVTWIVVAGVADWTKFHGFANCISSSNKRYIKKQSIVGWMEIAKNKKKQMAFLHCYSKSQRMTIDHVSWCILVGCKWEVKIDSWSKTKDGK